MLSQTCCKSHLWWHWGTAPVLDWCKQTFGARVQIGLGRGQDWQHWYDYIQPPFPGLNRLHKSMWSASDIAGSSLSWPIVAAGQYPGAREKYDLIIRRPPAVKNPLQDTAEATPVPLHHYARIYIGLGYRSLGKVPHSLSTIIKRVILQFCIV